MGVLHSQESAYAQEMRKWNAHHTEYGAPGRPFVQADYPAMMYRAVRKPDGTRVIDPGEVANSPDERKSLETRGYVWGGPKAALDALEKQEKEYAQLAAERNYDVRRMSPRAQSEVAQAEDAAGARHLPTIAEKPIAAHRKRKRGRPKKTQAAAAVAVSE